MPVRLKLFFGTLLLCFAANSASVKIEKPFISPGAVTVNTKNEVQINFRYSPADYVGEFSLIEVNRSGKPIKTIAKITSASSAEQITSQSNFLITKHTLNFDTIGTHRIKLLSANAESEIETIEVFPPGIPTGVSFVLSSIVKWRGREVVGNRLHVQLRNQNDYKLAKNLAESVGMNLIGYFKDLGTWQFGLPGKGSAAELDEAYRRLKSSKKVLHVEPDGILRAN